MCVWGGHANLGQHLTAGMSLPLPSPGPGTPHCEWGSRVSPLPPEVLHFRALLYHCGSQVFPGCPEEKVREPEFYLWPVWDRGQDILPSESQPPSCLRESQ